MPLQKFKLMSVYRHRIKNTNYSYMKVEVQSGIPTKIAFDGLKDQKNLTGKRELYFVIISSALWHVRSIDETMKCFITVDHGGNSYSWIELIARSYEFTESSRKRTNILPTLNMFPVIQFGISYQMLRRGKEN